MFHDAPETAKKFVEAVSWVRLSDADGSVRYAVLFHVPAQNGNDAGMTWTIGTATELPGKPTAYSFIGPMDGPVLDALGWPVVGIDRRVRAWRALHDREAYDLGCEECRLSEEPIMCRETFARCARRDRDGRQFLIG